MKQRTIIHIVGNRPQFIKLAVLHDAIRKNTSLQQFIIHTGQHSSAEMSSIFFNELSIPSPDVQLNITAASADVFIGNTSEQIHSILLKQQPNDIVFVYGDTNTTLAASMAARRSNLTLHHFEAGVRTADVSMPEEINRVLSDRLANTHYCCTEKNRKTLLLEGYGTAIRSQVIHSGDLMLDAFLRIHPSSKKVTSALQYVACTIHRAGNITNKENLQQIVAALNTIHQQMEVVVPLHPHTAKRLQEFSIETKFTTIAPLSYAEMNRFLLESTYVITDSGGASREAFFARKKSLILMEHPFWPEIVETAAALHCGADANSITEQFYRLPLLQPDFSSQLFGDGKASIKIAEYLDTLA